MKAEEFQLLLFKKHPCDTFRKELLDFDAVEESNSGVITAADAIVAIVEHPLLSILEEDLNETRSTR